MNEDSLLDKNTVLSNVNLVLLFCIFIFYIIYFPSRAFNNNFLFHQKKIKESFEANDKNNVRNNEVNNNENNDENISSEPLVDDDTYVKFYIKVFNQAEVYKSNVEKISRYIDTNSYIKILDAGCGVGRHYELLYKKFKQVIGIDKSNSFVKWAKIRNGNGLFIVDDFKNTNLFSSNKFSHITCFLDTIYHNNIEDMKLIFKNFHYWLNNDGMIFINIFLKDVLDPAPREFSQYYFDENKTKHSLTYFDNFTHDAWWKINGDNCSYNEQLINKDGKSFLKIHNFTIPNEDTMVKYITNTGFEIVDMLKYNDIDLNDMIMLVCRKKSNQ